MQGSVKGLWGSNGQTPDMEGSASCASTSELIAGEAGLLTGWKKVLLLSSSLPLLSSGDGAGNDNGDGVCGRGGSLSVEEVDSYSLSSLEDAATPDGPGSPEGSDSGGGVGGSFKVEALSSLMFATKPDGPGSSGDEGVNGVDHLESGLDGPNLDGAIWCSSSSSLEEIKLIRIG